MLFIHPRMDLLEADRVTTQYGYLPRLSKKQDKTFYLAFIDLRAAYDKVPRNLLFKVLNIYFNNSKLIKILELIYQNTEANIKNSKTFFSTKSGCRQGGIESPAFFNCYFDWVMRKVMYSIQSTHDVQNTLGITFDYHILTECTGGRSERENISGSCKVDRILFADDVALLFKTKKDMKEALEIADNIFSEYGLMLAYNKTETI